MRSTADEISHHHLYFLSMRCAFANRRALMPPSNTEAALGLPWLRLSSELGWGCLRTAIPIPPAAERLPEESGQNTSSILIQGEGEGKRERRGHHRKKEKRELGEAFLSPPGE